MKVDHPVQRDLEAIDVDDGDRRLVRDVDVPMVDVTNHVPMLMDDGGCTREVGGGKEQKVPVGVGESGQSLLDTQKFVELPTIGAGHEEAAYPTAWPIVEKLGRPGGRSRDVLGATGDHGGELARLGLIWCLMEPLGEDIRAPPDRVDRALPATLGPTI
jgi:hypothetical protein